MQRKYIAALVISLAVSTGCGAVSTADPLFSKAIGVSTECMKVDRALDELTSVEDELYMSSQGINTYWKKLRQPKHLKAMDTFQSVLTTVKSPELKTDLNKLGGALSSEKALIKKNDDNRYFASMKRKHAVEDFIATCNSV